MNSHRSGPWPLRKDDTQLGIRHLAQGKKAEVLGLVSLQGSSGRVRSLVAS